MAVSPQEMELLARQINQAHRMAVHEGLMAAGLSEVGHPMLLSILESARCGMVPEGAMPSESWRKCCISPRRRWQTP